MNREIKFRAWDGNRIRDVFKILFTETDGLIVYFTETEYGKEPGHLIERDSRLKLMQYTGLKDKNRKKIYEGDIVRVDWNDNRYKPVICEVQWVNETASWSFGAGSTAEVNWSHEIIGNIHESPELLK